jgi:hypothetical protein
MSEVRRYAAKKSDLVESIIMPWFAPEGEYVLADDYDKLEADNKRLQGQVDRVLAFLLAKKQTQIEIGLPHNPEIDREIAALQESGTGEDT